MNKLLWITAILLVTIAICGPVGDPDLWWHIVVGKWVLAHGEVPKVDLWNEFAAGTPWRAYSWSNEAVYAWVDARHGIFGLLLLKLLLSFCFVSTLTIAMTKIAGSRILGLLLGTAAAVGCYAHFGLRPQVVSWICFALCLLLSELTLRRKKVTPLLALALVCTTALWANSHISTIFGFLGIVLWSFDFTKPLTSLGTTSKLLGLAFLGTLCTPYFGAEWLTMLGKAQHPFAHMYIQEFQPATLYHAGANVVILLFATLLVLIHRNPLLLIPSQLCGAVILLFAALSVQKFIPFTAIYLAFLIARSWSIAEEPEKEFGNLGYGMARLSKSLATMPLLLSIPALSLGCLFIWGLSRPLFAQPLDLNSVAKKPLDFIESNDLPTPILNTFNDGGYILYRYAAKDGTPNLRVPLDGRTNVNTHAATLAFLSALRGKEDWRTYFKLVNPKTVLWSNAFPLVSVLLETEEWCHVYPKEGNTAARWSIFIRKDVFDESKLPSRNCAQAEDATENL